MEKQLNLFNEEIEVPVNDTSKLLTKISKPKKVSKSQSTKKSKKKEVPISEKIEEIHKRVLKDFDKYKNNTEVITSKDRLIEYINTSIDLNGDIAIDTETNFNTDPLTCKLMGLCLYSEGLTHVYVPINHVNYETGERLPYQLTEEELSIILENLWDQFCIYHHGKFDYSVIKYTCDIELPISWDTMIGSQLLNENELAGLKFQYKDKIDPTDEDYHADTYFDGSIPYEYFDPNIFALYAATDAFKTYKLYKHQKNIFEQPGNEKLYNLFKNIEMPVVLVTAEMENRGLAIDEDFTKRLSTKFHKRLDDVDKDISEELLRIKPIIDKWRTTKEANHKTPKKDIIFNIFKLEHILKRLDELEIIPEFKVTQLPGSDSYLFENIENDISFYVDLNKITKGLKYKLSDNKSKEVTESNIKNIQKIIKTGKYVASYYKSLNEQLADPPELGSPLQLGILLYDVLKELKIGKDNKKTTDEAALLESNLPLCKLVLKKREYEKYLDTYIDKLPECRNLFDNKIHPKYNQLGREEKNVVTGRMSSSDPNLQNIPARGDEITIRCMFVPTTEYYEEEHHSYELISNTFSYLIPITDEVLLKDGTYQWVDSLKHGDILDTDEVVSNIEIKDNYVLVYVFERGGINE